METACNKDFAEEESDEDVRLKCSERKLAAFMAEHEEVLAAADESDSLKAAGDAIVATFSSDPIRLNFELLLLCRSIVDAEGRQEAWDDLAERIILRVRSIQEQSYCFLEDSEENVKADNFHHGRPAEMSSQPSVAVQGRQDSWVALDRSNSVKSRAAAEPQRLPSGEGNGGWLTGIFSAIGLAPSPKPRQLGVTKSSPPKQVQADPMLLEQLVSAGFDRIEADAALRQAGNDEAVAVATLTAAPHFRVDETLAKQLEALGFGLGAVRKALLTGNNDAIRALELLTSDEVSCEPDQEADEGDDEFEFVNTSEAMDASNTRPAARLH